MNVIARLEFELAYYDFTVHLFNHYTTRTPPVLKILSNLSLRGSGFYNFPKSICSKVNVIARLEFELAYYDFTVHLFNHYTTRTPPVLKILSNLSLRGSGFYNFPKSICSKVNVIARLEFELAYYDFTVHRFNHYSTRTPPLFKQKYLTHRWEDQRVHTFSKGVYLKVNVIARLEFELAYHDSAVYRFNHYISRRPRTIYNSMIISKYITILYMHIVQYTIPCYTLLYCE